MRGRKMRRKILWPAVMSLALVAGFSSACGKKSESQSQPPTNTSSASTPKQPQTPFERDLDYVRKGQFTYIFVFSRKDGGAFDRDDIAYLKTTSPAETNQWISTDEGRRV